jgi:hypothetical protein
MVKRDLKIPLCKVANGVDLCIENALQFCSDAKILCDGKSFDHAWALCIFAVEELGKAILLKSKYAYAQKEAQEVLVLKKEKPEEIFHSSPENLNAKGFCWKKGKKELMEINPFYDHLSKLLIASNMMYMAARTKVVRSQEDKPFQSVDEIIETINEMLKEAYDIAVYRTNQRELALYVGYEQRIGKWIKGRPEVSEPNVKQLIGIVEYAIRLDHQWKLRTNHKS